MQERTCMHAGSRTLPGVPGSFPSIIQLPVPAPARRGTPPVALAGTPTPQREIAPSCLQIPLSTRFAAY
ncbi:hypothetical protein EVG20_g11370 [Dentipellis fragilis]|uniref:Uncharacterized protein n=1 Tax=Dentipellis fragilis TaxID=205917 RepID=A0A4Y9XLW0_9AGAM|nr:hypothetical protein EVG20_g11370 [Dentipellis fragilis]